MFWPFYLTPLKIACIIGMDPGLLTVRNTNGTPLGSATVSPLSPSNFESVILSLDEQTERQTDVKRHSLYIDGVADLGGGKGPCPLVL